MATPDSERCPAGCPAANELGAGVDRRGRFRARVRSSGQTQFEVPLGEFTLSTAAAVRLSAGEKPYLALVGSTDRETNRYRLLIVDSMRQAVYDEILDRYPRVLVASQADGSDTLFINDGLGLRQLRRN